ncbi:hypothetical protein [Caldivirga sp. UBA161]|uniref:hypothetical protein n=1 Tax=Caldivirga sp. UBA161 TaxID=1915569 RepID=UPI0025B7B93A|nr:hypothetical protein [Caldivirga sp. UBA161]
MNIRYLLIAHYHIDHVRYAWEIVKQFNCSAVVSSMEASAIECEEPSLVLSQ